MNALIITIHVLACITLVVLVLLQSGKEGMGVIFGGSSGSLFGSTGAGGLLSKLTIGTAAVFFVTSLTLTYLSSPTGEAPRATSIILDQMDEGVQNPALPITPGPDPESEEKAGQTQEEPVEAPSPGSNAAEPDAPQN
ncbi:MAG: preprotein translocase subunit SecG [Desulfovibrionales bacterium]